MDKVKRLSAAGDFSWLPLRMPGVAEKVAGYRQQYGADWVATCWRRGVVLREPGWFFAAEGPLAIGTLWRDPAIDVWAYGEPLQAACMVVMRPPEAVVQPAVSDRDQGPIHG